jgi:uncharacterized protein YbjT (DUF2867 family)
MSKTLLLAGATGLTGSKVLDLALNDDRYSKICLLVRKKTGITHPKIHEMVVDFDRLQITQSVIQFDDVVIALGTTIKKAGSEADFEKVDLTTVAAVADWAYSNGAQQCALISSAGADAKSSNFYLRTKGKAEQYLSSAGFTLLLIYRPGLLLGERNEVRKGEKLAQKLFGAWTQNISIFGKYSSILATQLAKAVIEGLNDKVAGTHILHFNEMKQYFSK